MDKLIILTLTLAVAFIKLSQGIEFNYRKSFNPTNHFLLIKGVIASVFIVPLIFAAIIIIFNPPLAVTAALIMMALTPAADLSIHQVKNLGGDEDLAAGVQIMSAALCVITIPLWIKFFDWGFDAHLKIQYAHLFRVIVLAILMPLILGLIIRKYFPRSRNYVQLLTSIAQILLVVGLAVIIFRHTKIFRDFLIEEYLIIFIATACAFILGLFVATRRPNLQLSLGVETSLRNPGLAYLIATENFAVQKVEVAMLPYVVTGTLAVFLCALIFKLLRGIKQRTN